MDIVTIKTDSTEWEYMWNWLASHPLNKGIEDPYTALHNGEGWQYMGSFKQKDVVIHTFRHRNHPTTNSIQEVSVKNSDTFKIDQIHTRNKL